MRHPPLPLRPVLWMLCACVLLFPQVAAATEPFPEIDFDGDGQCDQFSLDRRGASLIHVWLSASDTTQVIRARTPLVWVIAADLDGDHRPELIASDGESQIHVWSPRRHKFHSHRLRAGVPGTLGPPNHGRIEDDDPGPTDLIPSTAFAPFALTLCVSPHMTGPEASTACAPRTVRALRSLSAVDPFAPRPPPDYVPL